MIYYCVPADFKKETIDEYVRLNREYQDSQVIETYGNVTLGVNFGSGRVLNQLPKIDLLDLREYVEYSNRENIKFNFTLNAAYMQNREFTREGVLEINSLLNDLHEAGVRSLTIALPSLLELVKSTGLDFELKASAICHITNANKARAYKKMGFDRIVVDESIHRDFRTLKQIIEVCGDKAEIIANTMCHRNCAYRHFHYNETTGDSSGTPNPLGVNFFEHRCMLQRYDTVSGLLKLGWVRPEDIKYYHSLGIKFFKLQGRQHVGNGGHIRTLEHYLKQDYDGNLMDLLDMFNSRYSFKVYLDNKKLEGFLKPYYENHHFCQNNCKTCGYCDSFAKKCIDHKTAIETINSSKKFYLHYDQYKEFIDSINPEYSGILQEDDIDADFNMI